MNYICSARLKNIAPSEQQLKHLAELLQLPATVEACLKEITPFQHENHVEASECFRTWFPALAKLRQHQAIQRPLGNGFVITDLSVRFARFENQIFLYFLVECDSEPVSLEALIEQRDSLQHSLLEHYSNQLDFDFHVTSKIAEFRELLRLQPITPVFAAGQSIPADIQQAYPNLMDGKGYQRCHGLSYANGSGKKLTGDGKSEFVREQGSIIQLQQNTLITDGSSEQAQRSHFYNMLHTELAFFHRTQAMEARLAPVYRRIDFLKDLIHILEDQWIRIRTFFSIAPKFSLLRGSRTAHLFFNLLEVNGQVLALQNSIISHMDREHSKMQERYERLHFNAIQHGNPQEQTFLKQTHEEVERSFTAYHNNIDTLKEATGRLNEGISQLQNDFDSNTNIMLQLLVFILSIVLVVWGVITLGFDKSFHITGQTPLDVASLLVFIVACLVMLFGIFGLGARLFLNRATLVMRKSANRVIQASLENDGQLNDEVKKRIQAYLEQLHHDSDNGCQKRLQKIPYMHRVNQLLEVVIMLLPAVSLRHIDVDSANQHLKKAKMQLGIK